MTPVRSCVLPGCPGRRELEPDAYACADCQLRLVRQLADIESYLDIVTAAPSRNGDFGPRSPGFASSPPLRLDVVAMLDPRTEINGDGPDDVVDEVPNVRADIDGWTRALTEEHPDHPSLAFERNGWGVKSVRLLRQHIGWITQQPWVDEFAADINRVHGALRAACKDAPAKAFARCPEVIDGQPCGGALLMHEDGQYAQCRTCRATWRRDQLLDLMMRTEVIHGGGQAC